MKKIRVMSLVLALVMLLSSLSLAVSAEQADTIVLDTLVDLNIDEPEKVVDFYFTPEEDGDYMFFSTENTFDTYGYVFLGEEQLAYNDDGSKDQNFAVQVSLTAGVQYILRARAYSESTTGTAKVQISKMVPATAITVETSLRNGKINVGGYINYGVEFYPVNAYDEEFEFVSANPNVVETTAGEIFPVAPGTTTITATSESGLKDTFEITVLPTYDIEAGKEQTVSHFNPVAPTFKFKAPASANYSFYVKTPEGEVYANLFDGKMDWISNTEYFGSYSVLHFEATKGETYYISCESLGMTGQYTVGIKEMTTGTLAAAYDEYIGVVDAHIYPTVMPNPINSYIDLEDMVFTSSDSEVVSVDGDSLYCHKVGSTTITATNKDNISTTFKVTVPEPTPITKTGYYKFTSSAQQPLIQYVFTPATNGRYHINTFDLNGYITVDAEMDDGGCYDLTAGQDYLIYAEGMSSTEVTFFVLKDGEFPCLADGHKYEGIKGFAATTTTPGLLVKICSVCGATDVQEQEMLEAQKEANKQFNDISENAWYYEGVNFAFNSKLFVGTDTYTFSPEQKMSRAMFVTVLGRLSGVSVDNNKATAFKDVPVGMYYTGYVKWANEAGIVNGMSATTFAPNADITREQICVMMKQYIEFNEISLRTDFASVKFADENLISSWAKDAVIACQRGGIINGEQRGNNYYFNPHGAATRAQVATILYNYNKNYTQLLFDNIIVI